MYMYMYTFTTKIQKNVNRINGLSIQKRNTNIKANTINKSIMLTLNLKL